MLQVVSYPLALVRTRLQAQGVAGVQDKYSGMIDVLQKTIAKEGVLGRWVGACGFKEHLVRGWVGSRLLGEWYYCVMGLQI